MPILEETPVVAYYPVEKDYLTPSQTDLNAILGTSSSETTTDVIRRYFGKDAPLMTEVARCESHLIQTKEDGTVLKGETTPLDRGVFQISLAYHQKELNELGLNVHILEDNVKYAKILFDRNHLADWRASVGCWGKYL